MISRDDYFMGRDTQYAAELTAEMEVNAAETIRRTNLLMTHFYAANPSAVRRKVNSGWRPPTVNKAAGGAPTSKHLRALACDMGDADGRLDKWISDNLWVLEVCNLWREDPGATSTWCHVQIVPYGSYVDGKPRTYMP